MMAASRWQHVRRITLYMLLMFVGFVLTWLLLLAKVRSDGDNRPTLVTEVEIHSLHARWGMDILAVPVIAAVIAVARLRRRGIGDVVIALVLALAVAAGMAYFPSAVMGGHIQWPFAIRFFDPSGYVDDALVYATSISVFLLIVHRIAAKFATSRRDTAPSP